MYKALSLDCFFFSSVGVTPQVILGSGGYQLIFGSNCTNLLIVSARVFLIPFTYSNLKGIVCNVQRPIIYFGVFSFMLQESFQG